MNRLVANSLLGLIFGSIAEFDERESKSRKLFNEAKMFFGKNAKNAAKDGEFENLQLNAKDKKTYEKMLDAAAATADTPGFLRLTQERAEKIINDPKLFEAKHEVKSAYSPSELSEAINKLEDAHEVVQLSYFTGTNEGDLVYCCGIKYLKAKKGK